VRILGIDPGSRVMGWGVIDADGWDARFVAHGVVRLPGDAPLHERLKLIASGLSAVIEQQRPTVASVEAVFHAKNARAALVLGHARGVVLLVLAQASLPLFEYAPARVKTSVTGSGRAEKEQVQKALAVQLGLRQLPTPLDASDALAVAACHAAEARLRRHVAIADAAELRPVRRSRRRLAPA
jgi:crossover junction endodeoxyribonuclease RuvC